MKNFDGLFDLIKQQPMRRVAVAVGQDLSVVDAIAQAQRHNIAHSVLVGDEDLIRKTALTVGVDPDELDILHASDPVDAVSTAVKLVSSGQADILMKGHVHTDDFLRGVLAREGGLRSGSTISHVFVVEVREMNKLVFITDGAMNIAPDLEQKAAILLNAVHLANIFGVSQPRVAVVAAVEVVNPAMTATVDAAILSKMADRGQYVPACTVDGPFALDNAISSAAARHKKITGPVAGQADILLVPTIECGNMLTKSLVYFTGCRLIGLLVAAKAPVVLTSRADSTESKLLSIAGAVLMVNVTRKLRLKIGKVHY